MGLALCMTLGCTAVYAEGDEKKLNKEPIEVIYYEDFNPETFEDKINYEDIEDESDLYLLTNSGRFKIRITFA